MSDMIPGAQIDAMPCQTMLRQIGERLRIELRDDPPMPATLARLLARLPELDHHDSPLIAPSYEDADRMAFADAI